jgi:DNA-directed RNA polymerase subunit L
MSRINISNIETNDDIITFTAGDINISLANAVRRTIISNIPTVVFKTMPYEDCKVNIIDNTTRLNNEILKHRLSCIPIHITNLDFPIEDYVVELDVTNETDSTLLVTTEYFKIKNIKTDKYLVKQEVEKIFPANKTVGEYILFCRLRPRLSNDLPGEKIKFESKLTIGTSIENSAFNVVSACAYGFTPDNIKGQEAWKQRENKLKDSGNSAEDIEFERRNWFLHNAKRITKPDSFDYTIETIGIYDNVTLVKKACDILINKFQDYIEKSDKGDIEIRIGSTVNKTYDIILKDESYTIGKCIEYIFHNKYYKERDIINYVGFNKLHPHDDYSIIRVCFHNVEIENKDIYLLIKGACELLIEDFTKFKSFF